jgi:hypothetical protein
MRMTVNYDFFALAQQFVWISHLERSPVLCLPGVFTVPAIGPFETATPPAEPPITGLLSRIHRGSAKNPDMSKSVDDKGARNSVRPKMNDIASQDSPQPTPFIGH